MPPPLEEVESGMESIQNRGDKGEERWEGYIIEQSG